MSVKAFISGITRHNPFLAALLFLIIIYVIQWPLFAIEYIHENHNLTVSFGDVSPSLSCNVYRGSVKYSLKPRSYLVPAAGVKYLIYAPANGQSTFILASGYFTPFGQEHWVNL